MFKAYASVSGSGVYFVVVGPDGTVAYVSPEATVTAGSLFTVPANVPVTAGSMIGVGFTGTGRVPFDSGGDLYRYTFDNTAKPSAGATPPYQSDDHRTYSFGATVTP